MPGEIFRAFLARGSVSFSILEEEEESPGSGVIPPLVGKTGRVFQKHFRTQSG
jgi:hypothetical protein